MIETFDILFLIVSVLGVSQAIFLIVLLMDEGKRSFRANRWLMVFGFSVGMSFIDDTFDPFISPIVNLYLVPVFAPFFFAFIPSIYLYFREVSGFPALPAFSGIDPGDRSDRAYGLPKKYADGRQSGSCA